MAFRCESQPKYFLPFPLQSPRYFSLPSFSEAVGKPFVPQENTVVRTPYNFNDLSSSASESSSFTIPDPFLIKKIVSQVEFYFSDDNLSRDLFLLRHMQRNKMGFVSIKLLTTLKKMKYLTRNWRVTLYALQFSKFLELSEDGTKVRRKDLLPETLLNIPLSKTLLAWNVLPCEESICSSLLLQENFLDTITKLFGHFGDIACIRIFRPGKKLPSPVKKSTSSYPELLTRWCALVEYERLKSARKAFGGLSHKQFCSPGQSIKVIYLSTLRKTNVVSQEEDDEKIEEVPKPLGSLENSSPCSSPTEPDSIPVSTHIVPQNFLSPSVMSTTKSCNSSGQDFKSNSSSISHADPLQLHKPLPGPLCPSSISAPKSGPSELQKPSNNRVDNRVDPENVQSSKSVSLVSADQPVVKNSEFSNSGPSELQKPSNNRVDNRVDPENVQTAKSVSLVSVDQPVVKNSEFSNSRPFSTMFCKPVGVYPTVIRLPRGPDGTRGFHNTRGRGRALLKH